MKKNSLNTACWMLGTSHAERKKPIEKPHTMINICRFPHFHLKLPFLCLRTLMKLTTPVDSEFLSLALQ